MIILRACGANHLSLLEGRVLNACFPIRVGCRMLSSALYYLIASLGTPWLLQVSLELRVSGIRLGCFECVNSARYTWAALVSIGQIGDPKEIGRQSLTNLHLPHNFSLVDDGPSHQSACRQCLLALPLFTVRAVRVQKIVQLSAERP